MTESRDRFLAQCGILRVSISLASGLEVEFKAVFFLFLVCVESAGSYELELITEALSAFLEFTGRKAGHG